MTEELAIMIVLVTLILTVGFVAVARKIASPLIQLLEAMVQERQPGSATKELEGIRTVLDSVDDRLTLLEERQSFYETLESGRGGERTLPSPGRE